MTSVYIHWPFCLSKCPYCDFNSHLYDGLDIERFISAYCTEIASLHEILADRVINTIFYGGGTPSTAPPSFFERTIDTLAKHASLAEGVEITMEMNPAEHRYMREYKLAGINRLSIGVQSFAPEELKFLGRIHSSEAAVETLELADNIFDNYSFDLMYSLPNQSLDQWIKTLEHAMQYAKYHISTYQLTIEKGTPFFRAHRDGAFSMPDDDTSGEFYRTTHEILSQNSLLRYEVSNNAKRGYECRHNINYWEYGDYIGVGPGAHSRYTPYLALTPQRERVKIKQALNKRRAFGTISSVMLHSPGKWMDTVLSDGLALQSIELLSEEECVRESIIMGMRYEGGIQSYLVDESAPSYKDLLEAKLIEKKKGKIHATEPGILLLNQVIQKLALV